ncbi:hypothetical protein RFI_20776, partial [Reticulomyxa filosa]
EETRKIDGRMTHCTLAWRGNPKKQSTLPLSPTSKEPLDDRRLFVHQLAWKTTDETLRCFFLLVVIVMVVYRRMGPFLMTIKKKTTHTNTENSNRKRFSQYGDIVEAVVIKDKKTSKSRGYGFVTFKHKEGATKALVQANKMIDGRTTRCNYACEKDVLENHDISEGGDNPTPSAGTGRNDNDSYTFTHV